MIGVLIKQFFKEEEIKIKMFKLEWNRFHVLE